MDLPSANLQILSTRSDVPLQGFLIKAAQPKAEADAIGVPHPCAPALTGWVPISIMAKWHDLARMIHPHSQQAAGAGTARTAGPCRLCPGAGFGSSGWQP
jgi:hypothetical protein